jgi:hypothetical protein
MSEPTWHIVWDRSTALPHAWQGIVLALMVFAFFLWLTWQRRRRMRTVGPSLAALREEEKSKRLRESLGLYGLIEKPLTVAMIPLFVAVMLSLGAIPKWLQVRESLNLRGASVIEGPVQSARRWISPGGVRTSGTVKYELVVNGKTFRWQGDENVWRSNLVHNENGVFQVGKRVRVSYATITNGDELLRIEAENLCETSLKCSGFTLFGIRWESKKK